MKFTDVRKYVTGLLSASFVNKEVLDNFAENASGDLTYKGAAIEGGGSGITELPIATTETLGGVIVGDGLSVDETGVLSALGGGSSGDTYLNMSTTTLWEGEMFQVGDTGVCSESIENFDYLITYGMPGDVQTKRHLAWLKVDDIKNNYGENNFSYEYYESAYTRCSFTDDLNFKCTQSSASGSVHFIYTKIEGVKISGNAGTSGGSNTEIKSYTYTGTGSFGVDNPTILEFESKPEWVLVYGTATSTNNMTKSFFTVDSPIFSAEVYQNGVGGSIMGSGLLEWSEDYKSVIMTSKSGTDAHIQFNYADVKYTVTYATLGSGSESLTELPIATEDTLGGIIVGDGLDIDENGLLSVANSSSTGITIDTELSEESENPVQNKIITSELNKKIAILEMPTGQNLDLLLADNYTVYHANGGHASMGLPDDVSGSYDLIVSGSTRANKYYQQLFNNDKIYFRSAKLSGIDIDVHYIYQYQLPNSHNGYSGNNLYIQCNGIEYGKLTGDEKCFVLIEEATNTINVYNTKRGREVSVNYVNGAYSNWGMLDGTVTYSLTSFDLGAPTHTYENVQGLYSDVIPFFLDTQTEDILNFLNTGDKSAALNYQETVLSWSSWELLNNSITIDSELNSESTNPVQNKVISAKLDEVFQSVSNGKSKVAAAITDKGVNTAADATFETMAQNILAISSGGGNISFDISYTITREAAFQNTIIYVGALCYPNKGRDIKVYVNNNYLGLYTFSGADEAPEMLSLMFMFDLQAGDNIIRLVCDTKDIVLLTMEELSVMTFPTLTSDITTIDGYTYKTTASTCIDGSRLPYMPFNGTDALGGYDCWHPDFGEPQWLMIELPYQACIRSFTMQNRADHIECPKDVIFQGSNDSVNWVDITSFEFSYTGFEGITKTIKTDNTNLYKYYRWYIETVNAGHGVIAKIKDIDMIGLPEEKYILQYIV